MANPSIMDTLFQRSLEDLIKGIRLQSPDSSTPTSSFLCKSMEEIRREIKSTDPHTKSIALLKLTYLNSIYGFDMSWAAFHVVEVISYPQFPLKKIGYSAATASFHDGTDVLLLLTNQLRKDLSSSNGFEVSLALQCLSVIGTTDLCRDLCNEIFTLLSSTRIYVKKKAIAVVLRVFRKYQDAVGVCFKRLVDNLESSEPQGMSAVVGVFCELTLRDPEGYLPLAPEFYRILIDCKNNWVLIKVLKIFAKLAPLEPRLAKKIVDPICEIMRRTMAKSLMFECIWTVVSSLSEYESAVKLAVVKARELLVDDDPNLKYLGLKALSSLAFNHPWAVVENKDAVISSLSDADPNIKLASLRIVMSMVSEDNVVEISRVLINYSLKSDPDFCNEILRSILTTCSRNYYEVVFDFDWYISLLGEMSRIPYCQRGEEIENQLIDIGMRVKDARQELVRVARDLLIDPALLGNPFLHRILSAAAWVSGEYVELSKSPFELMEALLQPRTSLLPPLIRAVYIQSAFKVLVYCLHSYLLQKEATASSFAADGNTPWIENSAIQGPEGSDLATSELDREFNPRDFSPSFENNGHSISKLSTHKSMVNLLNLTEMALGPLMESHEVEIQERVRNILGVKELVKQEILDHSAQKEENSEKKESDASKIIELIYHSFSEELGPVSASAQARITVPNGLVLKDNLAELEIICGDIELPVSTSFSLGTLHSREKEVLSLDDAASNEDSEPSTESTSLLSEHYKRHKLYYLLERKMMPFPLIIHLPMKVRFRIIRSMISMIL
ncbi:hypothetical protein Nepgr_025192 [Nepenthes gracilis]|uniref:Clathrin/coatomer adaptor adaptin-like N-terminal domain-containing protein n=1 Tax=Nepenthes gracilis TaxID=150966 RepID=A0AAD3T5T0_NEPGR|nr:hypothetical protein Nepgr_025192 [Nepenthes gracilis]